ncbi:hypothetical protein BJV82DRAFT_671908 [Fennellomyces sp. T-0311]|nr:hypothetical protein BJV82DRAFT_671908 [Fennellomyces sp. T-0311]
MPAQIPLAFGMHTQMSPLYMNRQSWQINIRALSMYLHLNAVMDEEQRVEPVVKRCPNLRSFIGSTNHVGANISTGTVLRLDRLISSCPNITYLQTRSISGNLTTTPKHDIQEHAYNDRGVIGEKSVVFVGSGPPDIIAMRLVPIGHLNLHHSTFHSFVAWFGYGLKFDAAALVALLNGCPSIRTLTVRGADLTFRQQMLESLRTLENVRVLELIGAVVKDNRSMATMIQRLPALESLTLLSATLPLIMLANVQHLHRVHISINTWKDIESYNEASR